MRLKTAVQPYIISTIRTLCDMSITDTPHLFETVLFSDDEAVRLPQGEVVLAYYQTEFAARGGHAMAVAWVRTLKGDARYAKPPMLRR